MAYSSSLCRTLLRQSGRCLHKAGKKSFQPACRLALTLMMTAMAGVPQTRTFDYFGLAAPGNKLELFAPDILSIKDSKAHSLAVSPKGDEIFFSAGDDWPKRRIMHSRKIGNRWTAPRVAEFSQDCYATEPAFSPDGRYLYYSSSKGMKDIQNYSLWRVMKTGKGWSAPRRIIDIEDPTLWEFHPTITGNSLYFCLWDSTKKTGGIYQSTYAGGKFSQPEKVTLFNVQSSDANPFADPHGNYLVTCSKPENSTTGYDVYIFYRQNGGAWSQPVRIGDTLNTSGDEDSFDVSPDARFLFFYRQGSVYWTETRGIINQ